MATRDAALPLGAALAVLALVRSGRTSAFDEALTRRLERANRPPAHRLLALSAQPGYPPLNRWLPLAAVVIAARIGGCRDAGFQALAWGAASMGTVAKHAVNRPRPDDPLRRLVSPNARGSSFPSTHVLSYVIGYGFLASTARRHGQRAVVRLGLPGLVVALTVLVAIDRVAEGDHWPTDVLAAALFGVAALSALQGVEGQTSPMSVSRVRVPNPETRRRRLEPGRGSPHDARR